MHVSRFKAMDVEPSMFKSVGIFRALEYLDSLQKPDGRTPVILEWLAEDLHNCKDVIAKQLGKMKNFRPIIMSVLGLMIKGDKRYSLNATYIMAMLSEIDLVKDEILTAKENDFVSLGDASQPKSLLTLISCVIHNGDEQSVSNVLALLGNLLKTKDGIKWLLANSVLCLNDLLDDVIPMVSVTSSTSSSNAELIIGRMCSLEKGRNLIYCHPFFDQLISHLIFSLENVDTKVVQNAAYALAELCHSCLICKVVINTQWATTMAEVLLRLLASDHVPIKIHSCKALQSLASSEEGFTFLNRFQDSENMLLSLINMLDSSADNKEIGIAAVRFLATFIEHQDGRLRIRQNENICMLLKHYELNFTNIPDALKNDISLLNQQLEFLSQPDPPTLTVQGARSILVSYVCQEDAVHELWQGTTVIYTGQEHAYLVEDLEPYTEYSFRLRLLHGCDKSPFSAVVIARTLEGEPGQCLHVSANPMSCHQIQLSWDIPHCINGILKEYRVYRNECMVTCTTETCITVSGLLPQRGYKFEVSCVNGSHEGPKVSVNSKTFPETYNATSRPSVAVLSNQEVFVTWKKPLRLSGQLIRYELIVNGKVMYSGIDTKYTMKTLNADETYEFMVAVVSTEVTAKSEVVYRKTPKTQSNSTKPNLPTRNKNDALTQDFHSTSSVCDDDLKDSGGDISTSDSSKQSPDHVSGQIMQNLLDQYSSNYTQSTLTNSTDHGKEIHNPLLPDQKTLSFHNQKHARTLHQKSSLTHIRNSCSKMRK